MFPFANVLILFYTTKYLYPIMIKGKLISNMNRNVDMGGRIQERKKII